LLALICLPQVPASAASQATVLSHSSAPIVAVRFAPSGEVVGISEDGAMTLWNYETGHPIWTIALSRAPRKNDYTKVKIRAMDLSPDGRMTVVAYSRSGVDRNLISPQAADPTRQRDTVWEMHLVLIDVTNGAIKKDIDTLRDASVTTVVFAPSGKQVYVTTATPLAHSVLTQRSPTSTTNIISVDTGQVLKSFPSHGWIANATLSPDGRRFVASSLQKTEGNTAFYELQFYDADTGELLRRTKFETKQTAAIGVSLDGSRLAVGRSGREGLQLDLVSKDDEKLTYPIVAPRFTQSCAIAFTTEERIVVGGGSRLTSFDDVGTPRFEDRGGVAFILDSRTGQTLKTSHFKSLVTCLAVSRDGRKMAAGMYDGQIALTSVL
jgi:WD40 repeat protein